MLSWAAAFIKISKDKVSWQNHRYRIPNTSELWAQAKNCYWTIQRYWGRTSQKTSEGKIITLLGPYGSIHFPVHLEGRTPIRMGLEGTAWSQGDLKTNGNCPIGFRIILRGRGAVIPFFFSISPFWNRNVYPIPCPTIVFWAHITCLLLQIHN